MKDDKSNQKKEINLLELKQQEWSDLLVLLEKKNSAREYLQYAELAMQMKILAPEKFSHLNLENEAIGEAEKLLNLYYHEQNWLEFVNIAAPMKIILSDKISQIKLNNEIQSSLSSLLEQYSVSNLWSFVTLASKIKIIFPDQSLISEICQDEVLWEKIYEELKEYKASNKWRSYTSMAAAIKVAFPEKIVNINMNDTVVEKMFDLLEVYRQSSMWDQYAIQAARIKILVSSDSLF